MLTDSSHTCGSILDFLLISNFLLIGDTCYYVLSLGYYWSFIINLEEYGRYQTKVLWIYILSS